MISISERPKEVETRIPPRHWEGNLITGENNQSAIATLIDWTTRYTIIVLLRNKDSHSFRKAIKMAFENIFIFKKSLTYDQGK